MLTKEPESTARNAEGILLGHASAPAERAVEAAILRVENWKGREIRYLPMFGGLQNSNWRVHVQGDDRQYFLKVPGEGTDSFIDRKNSNAAAVHAAQAGISPDIVAFFPDTGIEIVEYLQGYRACTNGDMKKPETVAGVLGPLPGVPCGRRSSPDQDDVRSDRRACAPGG